MSEVIDMNRIAVIMSELVQDYNELARCWYEVFHDPVARDIELKFLDTDGSLRTYVIPNRAKDKNYIYNGEGDPRGVVSAPTGSMYLDITTGKIYTKRSTAGATGVDTTDWDWVMPLSERYLSGATDPDDTLGDIDIGTLYSNTTTGWLYTKTPGGWEQVGAAGFAEKTWCEAEFDKLQKEIEGGVVHLDYKETIVGNKTFDGDNEFNGVNLFTNNTEFNGVNLFTNKSTFQDVVTFEKVIMGTSYRALSADIAEYYEADAEYKPGTLVQFGGEKEITVAKQMVNAVVSTDPAYILNENKEMEHPALLALSGRVPVRVKGKVEKFDLIKLSDEEGVAIVDNSCYNPIGRALETNLEEGEKLVECVVKLNI